MPSWLVLSGRLGEWRAAAGRAEQPAAPRTRTSCGRERSFRSSGHTSCSWRYCRSCYWSGVRDGIWCRSGSGRHSRSQCTGGGQRRLHRPPVHRGCPCSYTLLAATCEDEPSKKHHAAGERRLHRQGKQRLLYHKRPGRALPERRECLHSDARAPVPQLEHLRRRQGCQARRGVGGRAEG